MEREYCCIDLEHRIFENDIELCNNEYYMHGGSIEASDGDGYTVDMTESFVIKYCPFCGAKL